jgi:benzylsuccinate CoA-transferase BbsF subunit
VYRLASISDAVVENMRPGVMERLGLGYQRLRAVNPSIIMASISAAGADGPESRYPGYAPVFNALSGMGHLTGYPDAPPTELRDSIDSRVGATTAFALLAALFQRRRTGQGQFIDLSSREAITTFGAEYLMEYVMNGRVAHRRGNREPGMAPHGCYRCRGDDSWATISVGDEHQWRALCRAAHRPQWLDDPRFADAYLRSKNQDALDELVEEWTQGYSAEEVVELLQTAGVPAAASASGSDLLDDPHLQSRGAWPSVVHSAMGRQTVLAPPWQFSVTPANIHAPAPLVGQHNHQVFVELLGHSADQVEEWASQGIID